MNKIAVITGIAAVVIAGTLRLNAIDWSDQITQGAVPVSLIYQRADCGTEQPGIARIDNVDTWVKATRNKNSVGNKPLAPPEFDGATFYLVSAGRMPSAGYHLQLVSKEAKWNSNNTLDLPLEMLEPEGMVATMITSPCVIVRLEGETIGPVAVTTLNLAM